MVDGATRQRLRPPGEGRDILFRRAPRGIDRLCSVGERLPHLSAARRWTLAQKYLPQCRPQPDDYAPRLTIEYKKWERSQTHSIPKTKPFDEGF